MSQYDVTSTAPSSEPVAYVVKCPTAEGASREVARYAGDSGLRRAARLVVRLARLSAGDMLLRQAWVEAE